MGSCIGNDAAASLSTYFGVDSIETCVESPCDEWNCLLCPDSSSVCQECNAPYEASGGSCFYWTCNADNHCSHKGCLTSPDVCSSCEEGWEVIDGACQKLMRKNEDIVLKFGSCYGNENGAYLGGLGNTDAYGRPKASWVFTDYTTHRLFVVGDGQDEDALMHGDYVYIERPSSYGNEANAFDTFFACPANWGHGHYVPGLDDTEKKKWRVVKVNRDVNDNIHWNDEIRLYNGHF